MHIFLTSLHVMACLILIVVVLLQRGKGAEMGAMLGGGGSQTVFGSRGAGNFLTKMTTGCAVIFMLTSLSLSYLGSQETSDLLFEEQIEETEPPESGLLEEIPVEPEGEPAPGEGASGALEEIPRPSPDPDSIPAAP